MADLARAKSFIEANELDDAWQIVDSALREKPNDINAMLLATSIMEKAQRFTLAYHVAKRVTEMYPKEPVGWVNLGMICDHLWLTAEAESCYRRALKLNSDPQRRALILNNMAGLFVQNGRFSDALPLARESLQINPDSNKARHNLGLCLLANRQWREGWEYYEASLGSAHRLKFKYGDEPDWRGEEGKTVVIYGEQGLGDEISAASMFNDALKVAGKVIVDCDPRLARLYQRSFPAARVYGTRRKNELDWDEEDRAIDYSCSTMQLGGLFRTRDVDFTGDPYLVADPDRVRMWRSLWATKRKPVIGLAWTGGIDQTAARFRQWKLDQLMPIFRSVDAHWVCLQYKDATSEIAQFRSTHRDVDLVQYDYATLAKDYDNTAALVASLDCVVSMQTTVIHLSGALGIDCACAVPHTSQWRYMESGDEMPWYRSVRLFRNKRGDDWTDAINRIAKWVVGKVGVKEAA